MILVNPAILEQLLAGASWYGVGKRAAAALLRRILSTRLMLRYARQGRKAGAFEGGDPCFFGRAG